MLKTKQNGFTIVELLIVIVVIAILAAITVVAFNGIQARASDSVAFNELFNKVSLGAYASSEEYPIAAITTLKYTYDEVTGQPTSTVQYGFAGKSKSGKVFYVNEATGGVSRSFTDWEQRITEYTNYIAQSEQNKIDYPEYSESYQQDIEYYQSQIERFQNNLDNGSDAWSLSVGDCPYQQEPVERKCITGFELPLATTYSYTHGGYIYEKATKAWVSIWGAWGDI